ncbi:hypothetical protein J3A64_002501 [Pseudarthrobacter sp. PvP004]|uniref:hypothetical protein n=1 Tax=Pseudarthrobacter sp. PvP004 TaxID=2817850 RepID=UPI002570C60B|nr:hypothetical protein [Pseudarthrobacter sp. PvP004]MBP2267037.1 hypothetical protein [Pseudarthrobacter sp. PvP004]
MFGNLGTLGNGNMSARLLGPTIGVKLSIADQYDLEANHQTQTFGREDRPMGGYVGLHEAWQDMSCTAQDILGESRITMGCTSQEPHD